MSVCTGMVTRVGCEKKFAAMGASCFVSLIPKQFPISWFPFQFRCDPLLQFVSSQELRGLSHNHRACRRTGFTFPVLHLFLNTSQHFDSEPLPCDSVLAHAGKLDNLTKCGNNGECPGCLSLTWAHMQQTTYSVCFDSFWFSSFLKILCSE